jgi:hypothetical protein
MHTAKPVQALHMLIPGPHSLLFLGESATHLPALLQQTKLHRWVASQFVENTPP